MATIRDVAQKAGVSVSTVSYAISGDRPISAEKKALIEKAMKELDYKPNAIARGLASKRSRIIAILFTPEERGLGLSEISLITCAAQAASEKGYHLVMWAMKTHDLDELRQLVRHELVDGVILMEVRNNDPRIPYLKSEGLPIFLFGRDDSATEESFVDTDFSVTMYQSIARLSGQGHRKICFVNQSEETLRSGYGPVLRAHTAFETICRDLRLEGTELLCPSDPLAGYWKASEYLKKNADATAFIVMNDKVLSGVIKACADNGKDIPQDVSIEALASSEAAATMLIPSITAWEMEGDKLMELAVGQLIARLEGTYFEVPRRLIPCTLVERSSSAPLHARSEHTLPGR
ncbi:LacI family transcriptional regulator [Treponema zuelzerae]|uniref:LacI family transcriptional regulator n=1 Tax=Teretinema zuelzerae TaxID=156 RepID=A0AAE3JJ08_9SPIR|nr:LacI family DNA-binding transcriptional regulator [Teretinema zuelzerae]MCD1655857.1 LacI family transcriptional regulator [Teretinema zuelzerae]